jgi:hypothetical protein
MSVGNGVDSALKIGRFAGRGYRFVRDRAAKHFGMSDPAAFRLVDGG